jgi:hypothetical protein
MSLSGFTHESKSQEATAASRDPNSSVTGDDAERVLLDESKKAGSAALQFDPNASPEEKAAQARSVRFETPRSRKAADHTQRANNTQRPPRGVGIVSDIVSNGPILS